MWSAGALPGYWDEVWRWGRVYAGTTFVENPLRNGALRTLNWAGFHAALVLAAALALEGNQHAMGCVAGDFPRSGSAAGLRFFPRYYFQILPGDRAAGGPRASRWRSRRSWRRYLAGSCCW